MQKGNISIIIQLSPMDSLNLTVIMTGVPMSWFDVVALECQIVLYV